MQIETTLRSDDELAQQHGSTSKTFWELFERYHEGVYSYFAVSTGGDTEKTLELAVQCFWAVLHRYQTFGQTGFGPWLFGIAWDVINSQRDNLQVEDKRSFDETSLHSKHPESGFNRISEQRALRVLKGMSFYPRETLYLRLFATLSPRDIGIMMDRSESTIKTLVCQGVCRFGQQRVTRMQAMEMPEKWPHGLAESYHLYLSGRLAGHTIDQNMPAALIQATHQLLSLRQALSIQHEMRSNLISSLQKLITSRAPASRSL